MITLLTGDNDYELTRHIARLRRDFDGTAERYDGAELTIEQLADIFAGQMLFAQTRLIILDTPSANPDLWKDLAGWSERLSPDTQLVLVEPQLDKRTAAFKWLKQHADVQDFAVPDTRDRRGLIAWVRRYANEVSLHMTDVQLGRLVDRSNGNLGELAQAIDKLKLVPAVTDEWIDEVLPVSVADNVFMLFETVLTGDVERLREAIDRLRLQEDPYRLLGLIVAQALQLTALVYGSANAAQVAADTQAKSAYPYQKLAPHAARLSRSQAKELLELLAAADVRLKSSDASPWLVLERTLIGMASVVKR